MPGKKGYGDSRKTSSDSPVYKMRYQGNPSAFPFKPSPTKISLGSIGSKVVDRVKSHVKGKIDDFKNKFTTNNDNDNDNDNGNGNGNGEKNKDGLGRGLVKDIIGGLTPETPSADVPETPMAKRSPHKFTSGGFTSMVGRVGRRRRRDDMDITGGWGTSPYIKKKKK